MGPWWAYPRIPKDFVSHIKAFILHPEEYGESQKCFRPEKVTLDTLVGLGVKGNYEKQQAPWYIDDPGSINSGFILPPQGTFINSLWQCFPEWDMTTTSDDFSGI